MEKLKEKQKIIKKEKGITLIALVVTIIVLLILAGVSIAMLTGEGGILKQAEEARERTEKANIIEQARVDLLEKQTQTKRKVSKEELHEVLSKYFTDVPEIDDTIWEEEEWKDKEVTSRTAPNIFASIGEIYNGKLEKSKEGKMAKELTVDDYGSFVKYPIDVNGKNGYDDDWKIFYVGTDENGNQRVFIISSEFVPSDHEAMIFAAKPENANLRRNTCYNRDFILEGGLQEMLRNGLFMANSYTLNEDYESNVYASRLLNTNNWKSFVNNDYAECAIGGPTLEMWVESWNSHTDKNEYPLVNVISGESGYDVSEWQYPGFEECEGKNDELYFPYNAPCVDPDIPVRVTAGYWLASPVEAIKDFCGMLDTIGRFGSDGMMRNLYYGFRPVVCLQSDIRLKMDEVNGIYILN